MVIAGVIFIFFSRKVKGSVSAVFTTMSALVLCQVVRSGECLTAVGADVGSFLCMCSNVSLEMLQTLEETATSRDGARVGLLGVGTDFHNSGRTSTSNSAVRSGDGSSLVAHGALAIFLTGKVGEILVVHSH